MALQIVWNNPLPARRGEYKVQSIRKNEFGLIRTLPRPPRGKVIRIKARNSVWRIVIAIGMPIAFLLLIAIHGEGQTSMQRPAPHVATAQIPFDFWIGGSHLPAGDYTLDFVLDTLVLFRNARANAQEQVFLLPMGNAAENGEGKLVFVVRNRKRDLQELWNSHGKAILTWRMGVSPEEVDTIEIALIEDRRTKVAAGR